MTQGHFKKNLDLVFISLNSKYENFYLRSAKFLKILIGLNKCSTLQHNSKCKLVGKQLSNRTHCVQSKPRAMEDGSQMTGDHILESPPKYVNHLFSHPMT